MLVVSLHMMDPSGPPPALGDGFVSLFLLVPSPLAEQALDFRSLAILRMEPRARKAGGST
jgi:hypothetical protein